MREEKTRVEVGRMDSLKPTSSGVNVDGNSNGKKKDWTLALPLDGACAGCDSQAAWQCHGARRCWAQGEPACGGR